MRISPMPKRKISTIFLILYTWLGIIYAQISCRLGGVVLILIGYLLLAWVLFPGKIRFREKDRSLMSAICWFCLMVGVVVAGTEILRPYVSGKNLGPFTIGTDTFHMIKSFPIWLSFLLIQVLDKDAYKHYGYFLGILVLDMVVTIIALFDIPNFAKYLAAGISTQQMRTHIMRGAMGYELTYSVALIIPLLFAQALRCKKTWFWAIPVVAVIYVIKCNFFLAIVLMLCNMCLALIFSIKDRRFKSTMIAVAIIGFIVMLINQTVLGNLLISFAKKIESYELRERVQQLGNALLNDDYSGRSLGRLKLYQEDFFAILKSPILGYRIIDPEYYPGGHSTVMGLWGTFGLVGIVPFVQVVRHLYRHTVTNILSSRIKGVVMAAYLSFFLLACVNPVFADPHIFACVIWVVPMITRNLTETGRNDVQRSEENENSTG